MLTISGSQALSDFRLTGLFNEVVKTVPEVFEIQSVYVNFVDISRELAPLESKKLTKLLIESGRAPVEIPEGNQFLVVPRPGTISPWSSKSTDIAHNAGLSVVNRIERGILFVMQTDEPLNNVQRKNINVVIHDRMTESVFSSLEEAQVLFAEEAARPLQSVAFGADATAALTKANTDLGLALSVDEIEYLVENYQALGRDPTDVELMMFAQANSEHCRHKIFNADFTVDGEKADRSLFSMIKNTHELQAEGVLSAYHDNAAVLQGPPAKAFVPDVTTHQYGNHDVHANLVIKVETHNHPTAISPFAGAATGSGGEIRDEGATGVGSRPKAGLTGFSVSNLRIPGFEQAWEKDHGKPDRIVSARQIMLEGPIGGAAFNNEFGRPGLSGYFRTYEEIVPAEKGEALRGYHKPIMIAGGVGSIRTNHVDKQALPEGTPIFILGGPAMLIGLGGGAASSMASGTSAEDLDFASVQRGNPEMQRRCQEVINACVSQGDQNPILSIHDIGAGGLSNAVPEIIHDADRGGRFELREVHSAESGMSPMEIWCNESQERYVLAIDVNKMEAFEVLCARERCPVAAIGKVTEAEQLRLDDELLENRPVDLPMEVLFGKPPKLSKDVQRSTPDFKPLDIEKIELREAIERVLHLPAVASKRFLITIGDRTVTGLVARDQMVGPWQVPVSDVAVTLSDYESYTGEAMAMGERTPVALLDGPASGRMAVAEAITNLAAARVNSLKDVKLSANWMAAAGHPGEDACLYDTVKAVGMEICADLGIAIPVGKDSLSMKTVWQQDGAQQEMAAPMSVIISAFAPVTDARKTLTPVLNTRVEDSRLILIDLGAGKNRLGASCLAQVYKQLGSEPADIDDTKKLRHFFNAIQSLNEQGKILAYHDRSDGGLFVTLCEMTFAGRAGVEIDVGGTDEDVLPVLFAEEAGAVIQVKQKDVEKVMEALELHKLGDCSRVIGSVSDDERITINNGKQVIYSRSRSDLHTWWAETSYQMQALRDNPQCARQEHEQIKSDRYGMKPMVGFDAQEDIAAPYIKANVRPAVAILREQGVNGHVEMAAAFHKAGFDAIDVHMTDILSGEDDLNRYKGVIAGGGFSYGDVLGAGGGWAKSVLHNSRARDRFSEFFRREDVFGLGVCNGCQMMSQLRELIPGTDHWPYFRGNASEQFEGRFSMVEILPSPSIFLKEMQGSHLPVAVAHGEGRAVFTGVTPEAVTKAGLVSMRYINTFGHETEDYPDNPNGSPQGITGLTTEDGRFTIMMPHPERVFRTIQLSWHPPEWGEDSPWMRMFRNARVWVD